MSRPHHSTSGHNLSTVSRAENFHGMTPTSRYGPAIGVNQHQNTPTYATAAGYNVQPFVHQAHPNSQSHPIVQHHPVFHHVGVMVSGNPSTPEAVPSNANPRTRGQRQMFRNPHSAAVARQVYANQAVHANQAFPSANASVMAQQAHMVQPAQPAAPSMDETIALFKGLMKEDETDFQDHIQSFKDLARFAEAEKRANLVPTPELARDFPADTDRQVDVAHGFFNSLVCWKTQNQPMSSKVAANRIKSKKLIEFKIVAWKLLVDKSQALVSVDTN